MDGQNGENTPSDPKVRQPPIPPLWVEYKRKIDRREREVRVKTRLIGLFVMLATWINLILLAVSLSDECYYSLKW